MKKEHSSENKSFSFKLEYPWPSKLLSPNCHDDWRKKYRAQQQYKQDCFFVTTNFLQKNKITINNPFIVKRKKIEKHFEEDYSPSYVDDFNFLYTNDIDLNLFFYPPNKINRDLDNLQARAKYLIDGAFLALNCDDKIIKKITSETLDPKQDGGVLVEFIFKLGDKESV